MNSALSVFWNFYEIGVVVSAASTYTAASLGDGLLLRGRRGVGWLAFGADYSGYAGMTGTGFLERPFGGSEKDRKVGLTGRWGIGRYPPPSPERPSGLASDRVENFFKKKCLTRKTGWPR
mgnify:CR=1 FL=1